MTLVLCVLRYFCKVNSSQYVYSLSYNVQTIEKDLLQHLYLPVFVCLVLIVVNRLEEYELHLVEHT